MTEAETALGGPLAAGAVRSLATRHTLTFGISFGGIIVLARLLGPEQWGIYAMAFVAQTVAVQIIERGVVAYLIRLESTPSASAIGTAVGLQAVLGVISALVFGAGVFGAHLLQADELTQLLAAVAVVMPFYAVRAVPLGLLERDLRYARVGAIEVSDVAVFFAVACIAVVAGFGLPALAAATVLRGVASAVLAWMLVRPQVSFGNVRSLTPTLRYALPYTGSQALVFVNAGAAPLLVGGLVGAGEFGFIQLAYTLIVYPQALTAIIARVAFVSFSREGAASSRPAVSRATARLLRYAGGLTLVLATTSLLWVPVFFGIDWSPVSAYMLVVAPTYALAASLSLVVAALNASSQQVYVFRISALYSLSYWLLAAALVRTIGGLGLPVAQGLATVTFMAYLGRFRSVIGELAIMRDLLEFFVTTLLMLIAVALSVIAPNITWVGCVLVAMWVVRGVRPLTIYHYLGRATKAQ